jgi:hypothetical protein
MENAHAPLTELDPLVGVWRIGTSFDAGGATVAETAFEWLGDRQFLVQRWHVDHPDAPDGIALIGAGPAPGSYVQHYFDERGVERDYDMTFADGRWTLTRIVPGFSQQYVGELSADGSTITGHWDMSDDGTNWQRDFDLTYTRVAT